MTEKHNTMTKKRMTEKLTYNDRKTNNTMTKRRMTERQTIQ
jgi:hypothetical protein